MALSKDKKAEVVSEVSELLSKSKLTVMAKYSGTSVKSLQELRRQAKENGTTISVVKNRLVKKSLEKDERFKDLDVGLLVGTIAAPLSGFVNVMAGNVRGIMNVLNARADQIG
jgi:ribosomal protein L10